MKYLKSKGMKYSDIRIYCTSDIVQSHSQIASSEARMGHETRKTLSPTRLAMVILVPVGSVTCLGLTLDSLTY